MLDDPVKPSSSNLGDVGEYSVKVLKTTDGRKLIYQRHFDWGRKSKVLIPVTAYKNVKQVFDFVQDRDSYTISLKAGTQ